MIFKPFKPLRWIGGLRPLKAAEPVRRSARAAKAAVAKPVSVEEIRGVTVTTWVDKIVVSEGVYTTYRYRDRLSAAGGKWVAAEKAWHLPAGSDVRVVLAPGAPRAGAGGPRPSWVCCEKAKILSYKNQHYSCFEHTMYWENCHDEFGNPIKILYAASTCGGSPYTGT